MSVPRSPAALVVGGTGAVGAAVVRALAAEGVPTTFTFHRSEEAAARLAEETGQRATRLDVTSAAAVRALADRLADEGRSPDVVVLAAAVLETAPCLDLSDGAWDRTLSINARSAFLLTRAFSPGMIARGAGDIVLLGGLERSQSLPVPAAYAASQGALGAFVMAAAKELGPKGVRVNMIALGLLDRGLSLGLSAEVRHEYVAQSALRRFGTPEEVAKGAVWLALHNGYVSGKVIALNGGI